MENIVARKCVECGKTKPIEDFNDGGLFFSTVCGKCRHKPFQLKFIFTKFIKPKKERDPKIYNFGMKQRRERVKKNGGNITKREWAELKKRYHYTCLACGRREPEIKLTLDHVIPIVKGGPNTIDNAQPLCRSCNSKKMTKIIDYR